MTTWVEFLRGPAVHVWGVPVSWAELLGDVTGLLCVWLTARQHVWSWPLGLLNNAFFLLLFFWARLYADASLQVVFAALGAYGWWCWTRGAAEKGALPVRRMQRAEWWVLAVLSATGTALVRYWLATRTDSPVPFWDALVLMLSLAATYGQARKLLESWWLWIAVDVVSVPLYASRGLHPTALLYCLFGFLCVVGLRDWMQAAARQRTEPALP
jgi:nicotinamide mononucleotide transporter